MLSTRVGAFAMAATLTWSMLFGIDSLATTRHAAHDLMAQTRATDEITRRLLGRDGFLAWFSLGDFSQRNLVRALLAGAPGRS